MIRNLENARETKRNRTSIQYGEENARLTKTQRAFEVITPPVGKTTWQTNNCTFTFFSSYKGFVLILCVVHLVDFFQRWSGGGEDAGHLQSVSRPADRRSISQLTTGEFLCQARKHFSARQEKRQQTITGGFLANLRKKTATVQRGTLYTLQQT